MIQLNFVSKKEIKSFKDGAQIQAAFIYDDLNLDESGFKNDSALSAAISVYDASAIHKDIAECSETLANIAENFDLAAISNVIKVVNDIDPDMYGTIVYFIHALLQQKDINSRKVYVDEILALVEAEFDTRNARNNEDESESESVEEQTDEIANDK